MFLSDTNLGFLFGEEWCILGVVCSLRFNVREDPGVSTAIDFTDDEVTLGATTSLRFSITIELFVCTLLVNVGVAKLPLIFVSLKIDKNIIRANIKDLNKQINEVDTLTYIVSAGGGINIGVILLLPSEVLVSICLLIGPLTGVVAVLATGGMLGADDI